MGGEAAADDTCVFFSTSCRFSLQTDSCGGVSGRVCRYCFAPQQMVDVVLHMEHVIVHQKLQ